MSPVHKDEDGNGNGEKKLVNGKVYTGVWALLQMIGNFAGLASLLTVAIFGGEIKRQVAINTDDIKEIRSNGSPTLKETIRVLNAEVEGRKESDVIINHRVDDVRGDFSQRIQNITGLLEKLVEQQTQLITLIKVQQQVK